MRVYIHHNYTGSCFELAVSQPKEDLTSQNYLNGMLTSRVTMPTDVSKPQLAHHALSSSWKLYLKGAQDLYMCIKQLMDISIV